ncbi:MAG: MarR family transcriptional regulator [Alphaproteobacteria bacterium]|nr:MarR family transcriptional regulator [Alphaproteobacteria bacterium]
MSARKNANDEPLDLGGLPDLLGYQLRRAQIAAFQHFAATVGKAGITPGWYGLMVIVANNEGLSQTRLARALGIDGSTMVAMIDRLEENGWIERQRSEVDRRSHALHLTAAGNGLLAELTPQVAAHEAELARELNADDKSKLLELLAKIAQV